MIQKELKDKIEQVFSKINMNLSEYKIVDQVHRTNLRNNINYYHFMKNGIIQGRIYFSRDLFNIIICFLYSPVITSLRSSFTNHSKDIFIKTGNHEIQRYRFLSANEIKEKIRSLPSREEVVNSDKMSISDLGDKMGFDFNFTGFSGNIRRYWYKPCVINYLFVKNIGGILLIKTKKKYMGFDVSIPNRTIIERRDITGVVRNIQDAKEKGIHYQEINKKDELKIISSFI